MQPAITEAETKKSGSGRPRKRVPISFILAGVAILGAIIYLVSANTRTDAVYYMTVPELSHCSICTTQAVRVAGIVQSGSIQRNQQTQTVTFKMSDGHQALPVTYTGVVPDIFRPGIQVVVEGHYPGQGTFQAQTLLAKCPSKFQSATPTPISQ